jgi:tetratricopeptide (TPR) repeat protein
MRRSDLADEPRFEMLESIREFALEQLDTEPGLAAEARSAHASYYASWTGDRPTGWVGTEDATTLSLLLAELENLRSAWRECVEAHDLERLQALMGGLWRLYDARGWYRGVTDLAGDVLALLDTMEQTPERTVLGVTLRSSQARALMSMEGYSAEAERAFERLLDSVAGGDVPQVYPVLRALAAVYAFRAEQAKAAEIGRQILRLGEALDDPSVRVDGYLFAGTGSAFGGQLAEGLGLVEEGVGWLRTHPYTASPLRLGPDSRVSLLTAAARLLRLWRREPEAAREFAVRAIEIADEHELHIWNAVGTVLLGAATVELGAHEEGLRRISDGMARYRGLRTPPVFWPFLLQVGAAAYATAGHADEGLRSIGESLELAPLIPDAHVIRGDLLQVAGRGAESLEVYRHALELARGWGTRMTELRAALRLCRAVHRSGDATERSTATETLRGAFAAFTEGLDSPDLVEARELLANP